MLAVTWGIDQQSLAPSWCFSCQLKLKPPSMNVLNVTVHSFRLVTWILKYTNASFMVYSQNYMSPGTTAYFIHVSICLVNSFPFNSNYHDVMDIDCKKEPSGIIVSSSFTKLHSSAVLRFMSVSWGISSVSSRTTCLSYVTCAWLNLAYTDVAIVDAFNKMLLYTSHLKVTCQCNSYKRFQKINSLTISFLNN